MKPRNNLIILTTASALLLAPAAFAGNIWDGGGLAVDDLWNWTDNTNWNSNTAPDFGSLLTFSGTAGPASNNNGATTNIAGITFSGTAGAFTLSGSSVTLSNTITNNSSSLQTINLPLVLDNNRTITGSSGNVTLGGPISGAFNLIKSGTHTLTMNNAGSSFSRLQINAGTVGLGVNDALPTTAGLTTSTATSATLDLNGKTQTLGGTIIIAGTAAGTVTISDTAGGGILKLGNDVTQNSNSLSNVTISAALDLNGATRSFTPNNSATIFNVSGAISNSTGTAGLTKAGVGTLTLSGTNSYNGATAVNAGSLIVNGSTSTSSVVSVSNTDTRLMGTGTVGGNTTINTGAIHSAGTATGAVGNQNFSGNLTYANGSIFEWDINANSTANGFDKAVVSGDLAGGASSIFRVVFGTTAKAGVNDTGNTFWNTANASQVWNMTTLFGKNFTSGAFGSVETYDSAGFFDVSSKGSFTITGSTLTWTAVPEPTSALAGVLLAAGMLRRRRA